MFIMSNYSRKATGVGRIDRKKTLFALFAVIIMLLSSAAILGGSSASDESSGSSSSVHSITYYEDEASLNSNTNGVTVEYDGIASTEYNPAYSDVFKNSGWSKLSETTSVGSITSKTVSSYKINVTVPLSEGITLDLSDWNISGTISAAKAELYSRYPGYCTSSPTVSSDNVITYSPATYYDGSKYSGNATATATITISRLTTPSSISVPYVFCGWTSNGSDLIYPGDVVDGSIDKLYAKWATPDVFLLSSLTPASGSTLSGKPASPAYATYMLPINSNGRYTSYSSIQYSDGRTEPTMFTTIYEINGAFPTNLSTGTYRSNDPDATVNWNKTVYCDGDVIIDSVHLNCSASGDHGDPYYRSYPLFANGHRLILGTGLDATSGYRMQVFGGLSSGTLDSAIETGKSIVSYDDGPNGLNGKIFDIGTFLIVHSGTYYSIGAVGWCNLGTSGSPLSSYMVLKGGTITDTVVGGSSYTIWGAKGGFISDSNKDQLLGGTFTYVTGAKMTGDTWEESKLGYASVGDNRTESSILEGGPGGSGGRGSVYGAAHTFITDKAKLWDAQAGGRRGDSTTQFAYMEISGSAVISHIACGTITDGNSSSGNRDSVGNVKISTYDNCKVGMLFGAGYDTWAYPTYTSMLSGTIDVEINGGTIGYVYGGGYRGSVGTSSSSVAITVAINGGTVLKDVYGGGRGGVDKILHNATTGNREGNSSYANSMGKSYVYGTINVVIAGGTIGGNVYGGGESLPKLSGYNSEDGINVASVIGSTNVTVTGGEIKGSVYGAGKGVTIDSFSAQSNSGTLTFSGTIPGTTDGGNYSQSYVVNSSGEYMWLDWFSGFTPTYDSSIIERYLEFAEVDGSSGVTVSGGTIGGSVYGGGAYGRVTGDAKVSVSGGSVGGSVYGGAIGHSGITAVEGDRYIDVSGTAAVTDNIYGGTAYGNDGVSTAVDESDATICIQSGSIGGSLFGGGFQGTTYGDVKIYIGYRVSDHFRLESTDDRTTITIGGSVYIGGDVGEIGENDTPYTQYLVMGGGNLSIFGAYSDISISGSLMGSGNACLTKGNTVIYCDRFINLSEMHAIHRATTVTLSGTMITLKGRGTVDANSADSLYSLFMIVTLQLRDSSVITLDSAVDAVTDYYSQNKDGNPTTPSSPSNKIIIGSGNSLTIRGAGSYGSSYGTVSGYTVLSVSSSDGGYGAYVLGSTASSGGFVATRNGTYVQADFMDVSDYCRCWFISGTITSAQSVRLSYTSGTASESVDFSIIKLRSDTVLRYMGGSFVTANTAYSLVETPSETNQFGVSIVSSTSSESESVNVVPHASDSKIGTILPTDSQNPTLSVTVSGIFGDESHHIGYCTIYLQEASAISYVGDDGSESTSYVLTNSIQLTVEIYTEGSGTNLENDSVTIGAVHGSGSGDIMIPSKLNGYTVAVESVSSPDGSGSTLTIAAEMNLDNTSGWSSTSSAFQISPSLEGSTLGELNGGYTARLVFSVTGFDSTESEVYTVVLSLSYEGTVRTVTVTVTVQALADINVTFVDMRQDSEVIYAFPYGTVITEADCPPTLSNFIGWYYESSFESVYSYSTPLTADTTLYARYMLTVTFDSQDGTVAQMYVADSEGGTLITAPSDPSREGYTFSGWYTEKDCINKWDFTLDKVVRSMTLYAGWVGQDITVTFTYNGTQITDSGTAYTATVQYGSVFGVLDEAKSSAEHKDVTILAAAESILRTNYLNNGEMFIRWQAEVSDSVTIPIYDDTTVDVNVIPRVDGAISSTVNLIAVTSDVALQVTMDGNSSDLTTNVSAPVSFLVYPDSDSLLSDSSGSYWEFVFNLNDATRSGWLLAGWSESKDAQPDDDDTYGNGTSVTVKVYVTDASGNAIDSPNYERTYYAVWDHIPYTVTIMESSHGTIDAYYNGVSGSTFTAYYGDRISLRFTPYSGQELARWVISGEGTIPDDQISSSSATLIVTGDCAVYANTVGPQIVQLYVSFNGGEQIDSPPRAMLSTDGVTAADNVQDGFWNTSRNCYQYQIIAGTGDYYICLEGKNGTLYSFGQITVGVNGNSQSLDVLTVTDNITDADGGHSSVSEYISPGSDVNLTVLAGYGYSISYAIGSGDAVVLGTGSPASTDTHLSFNVPSDTAAGIVLTGTVKAASYTLNLHLVYDGTFRDSKAYSVPQATYTSFKFGTSFSTVIPADSEITSSSGTTLTDDSYAVVAWYLTRTVSGSTVTYSDPIAATRTFDAALLNSTGVIDLWSRIIDITNEYQVTVEEKVMNVNGVYESVSGSVVAHAVTEDTSGTDYKDKIYSGTYVIGDYSTLSRNISIYAKEADHGYGTPSYTISGNEMTFTLPWGYAILIEYVRPSIAVSFDFGTGTGTSDITEAYYEQEISLPDATPPDNYTFSGWSVTVGSRQFTLSADAGTYTVTSEDVESSSMVFTAVYEPQTAYTLTLVTEIGAFSNGYSRISFTVGVGEDIQGYLSSTPTVESGSPYTFSRWSPATVAVMPENDLTYTAVWTIRTYTLTFAGVPVDENGTSVGRDRISAAADKDTFVSGNSLPYNTHVTLTIKFDTNYTLGSFSPSASVIGSAPSETGTRTFTWSFFLTQDTDIKITPEWAGLELQFFLVGTDGTVTHDTSLDIAVQRYGDASFSKFTRAGYTDGNGNLEIKWYTDRACTTEANWDEASGKYIVTGVMSSMAFYAKPVPNTYTVKYIDSDGTEYGTQTMTYDVPAQLSGFTYPAKDGYIFIGWEYGSKFYIIYDVKVLNLTDTNGGTAEFVAVWAEIPSVDVKYDGTAHSGSISADHGTVYYGTVNLTASNYGTSGSTTPVGYTQAGTYTTYYFILLTNENSGGVDNLHGSFEVKIEKRDVTFTSGSSEKSWDGEALTDHTVTVSGDGLASGDTVTYDWTGTITDVGTAENTFTVVWSGASQDNYNVTVAYGTLEVLTASGGITVSPTSYTKTYGDASFSLNAKPTQEDSSATLTYASGNESVVTVDSSGNVTIVGVGSARITINLKSDNVTADPANVSITVNPKELTVTYDESYSSGISKVYDGSTAVTQALEFALSGIVSGDEGNVSLTASYAYTSANASASVPVRVALSLTGDRAGNYTVSDITLPGSISAKTVTLTSSSASKVFDNTALTDSTVTVSPSADSSLFSSLRATGSITNAGTASNTIVYTLASGVTASNYSIVSVPGTLTVTVRYIDVPAASAVEYTGSAISASNAFAVSPYYRVSGTGTAVGEYDATLSLTYAGNTLWNTDPATGDNQTVKWTIAQGTIKASDFTVNTDAETYSGADITKEISSSLTLGTDYRVAYSDNRNAGRATITITGIGGYAGTVTFNFTIQPKELTIVLQDTEVPYDGQAHNISYEMAGLADGDTEDGAGMIFENNGQTQPGTYTVTLTGLSNTNYKISDNSLRSATLTIEKYRLIVIAASAFTSVNVTDTLSTDAYTVIGYRGSSLAEDFKITVSGTQSGCGISENTVTVEALTDSAGLYEIETHNGILAIFKTGYSSVHIVTA